MIHNIITNGQLRVKRGQQSARCVNKHWCMYWYGPTVHIYKGWEDNLLDELNAERTQVKQEDNIACLWSVSCELVLNCGLHTAPSTSKEHNCSVSPSVWTRSFCSNLQPLRCILCRHVSNSLLLQGKCDLQKGVHIYVICQKSCCPVSFYICKDQTLKELIRNRLQLSYQLLQSRVVWKKP